MSEHTPPLHPRAGLLSLLDVSQDNDPPPNATWLRYGLTSAGVPAICGCMSNESYQLQGQNGGVSITGSASYTLAANGGPVKWIQFLADTVVTALTSNITGLSTTLTGMASVPAGTQIGGETTAITITSGSVVLYF
jgi:hypothetical protein